MDIPKEVMDIMLRNLHETNGQFHDPKLFFCDDIMNLSRSYKRCNHISIPDAAKTRLKMKDLRILTMEEFQKLREEKLTIIFIDGKGNFLEQTSSPEIRNNEFGGGTFDIPIIIEGFTPYIEFHNHPLYRENIHNHYDLFSYVVMYLRGLIEISCVGMVCFDGSKDIFCIQVKHQKFAKIKEKYQFLINHRNMIMNEILAKFDFYNKKYGVNLISNDSTGINFNMRALTEKERNEMKILSEIGNTTWTDWNTYEQSIKKKLRITSNRTDRIYKKGAKVASKKGIRMLYPRDDDAYDYVLIDTGESIQAMERKFKKYYGKWFDIQRLHFDKIDTDKICGELR